MKNLEESNRGSQQQIRLLGTLLCFAFAAMIVAKPTPGRTQDASPAYKVADGRPWRMTSANGIVGTLVLFRNRTGKMTGGPLELSPKWRPTSDGLCLKPGALLSEQCVKLSRTGNGYVGLKDGKPAFSLER